MLIAAVSARDPGAGRGAVTHGHMSQDDSRGDPGVLRRGAELLERVERADERCEVPDDTEVRKLVGVHDHADAADLAAGDFQRPHADQPLLTVQGNDSRTAIDLGRPQREIGTRDATRIQVSRMWATRLRPRSDRASAGTFPPPSPVRTTSCAKRASSPARSPCWVAARNLCASSSRCSREV